MIWPAGLGPTRGSLITGRSWPGRAAPRRRPRSGTSDPATRPRLAEDGLAHDPAGISAVRLHAILARALADCAEPVQARAAMTAAQKAGEHAGPDELHDGVGGEFAFDEAKQSYYGAITLLGADDPAAAQRAASKAVGLYEAVPARVRSYGCNALAQVELAKAQLMTGKLDDAAQALGSVLALDPSRRISSLNQHLDTCPQ